MVELIEVETERLRLRQWKATDRVPFAALNADSKVMQFFPSPLTRVESDAMADRCQSLIEERGWGFWAAEVKATQEFIGFIGLHTPSAELPFSPCVEVGWRLAFQHWGKGFASEAAREAIRVGFQMLGLREVVSFATVGNLRSRAVMERLGMQASGTLSILKCLRVVACVNIACTVWRVVPMTHNPAVNTDLAHKAAQGRLPPR